MKVHLVHGIHTPTGDPEVRELVPYLRAAGFDVRFPDYGWIAALETRIVNPLMERVLLPYLETGDVLIGHSNGAAIAYDLMNLGAPVIGAVFINAALQPSITRPAHVKWIDVYFNAGDEITEAAQIAERLHLVDLVWGEMGHRGYEGTDSAITGINCGASAGMPVVSGHSDIFALAKIAEWGPFIVKRIAAATGA